MLESVVARHGARIAVEIQRQHAVEQWTYRELHDSALAHAARLVAAGVTPGDRCAILADNDPRWCAAYLGILRLGAVVVPLDTNYTAAQVASILADAQPRLVFINDRLEEMYADGSWAEAFESTVGVVAEETPEPPPVDRYSP